MKTSVLRISKAKKTKKKMNFLKMVKVTQRKTVIFMSMYLNLLTLKIMLKSNSKDNNSEDSYGQHMKND